MQTFRRSHPCTAGPRRCTWPVQWSRSRNPSFHTDEHDRPCSTAPCCARHSSTSPMSFGSPLRIKWESDGILLKLLRIRNLRHLKQLACHLNFPATLASAMKTVLEHLGQLTTSLLVVTSTKEFPCTIFHSYYYSKDSNVTWSRHSGAEAPVISEPLQKYSPVISRALILKAQWKFSLDNFCVTFKGVIADSIELNHTRIVLRVLLLPAKWLRSRSVIKWIRQFCNRAEDPTVRQRIEQ